MEIGGTAAVLDIYCDGLSLPQGGTTYVSLYSIRFSNLREIADVWFKIGIAPFLQTCNVIFGEEKKRKQRREIFQPFLFEVNKPLFKASKDGILIGSCLLFP